MSKHLRRSAEHHIARSRVRPVRVGTPSSDDEVGKAVAIDIAGAGNRKAAPITSVLAVEPKTVGAVKGGELDRGGKAGRLAETK
jgi:hypothetical protein